MTAIVGVLNYTPDSFSDGGDYDTLRAAVERVQQLLAEGALFVDIGAESTRPRAVPLTADQEWQRLAPLLAQLTELYQGKLSVDTYHPETVERVLASSSVIINDVTGMNNPAMVEAMAKLKPTVIVSHLPGADIQKAHKGPFVTTVEQVKDDLLARARELESRGLQRDQIILDPGIGFGKTMELNRELLQFAQVITEYPVMIGYSRKRFLGENRMELAPNLAAGRIAIRSGAAYIRVHDVAAHRQLLY